MEVVIHGKDPSQAPGVLNIPIVDAVGNLRIAAGATLPVNNFIWNTNTLAWEAATGSLGAGGAVEVTNFPATQNVALTNGNPLAAYKPSDLDTGADPNYFGFLDGTGNWYVLRLSIASGQARYAKGTAGGYAAGWTGRAGLTYDYFSNVF